MKRDLIKLAERVGGAALMGVICYAVFTVFTGSPIIASNPLAVAVTTGICVLMPLLMLTGFGDRHTNKGGRHED